MKYIVFIFYMGIGITKPASEPLPRDTCLKHARQLVVTAKKDRSSLNQDPNDKRYWISHAYCFAVADEAKP